jgi:tetratricopeptide (TPR) repeat protein
VIDDATELLAAALAGAVDPEVALASLAPGAAPQAVLDALAFAAGRHDDPPSAEGLCGDLLVLVLTVRASEALEHGRPTEAVEQLSRAADEARAGDPVLAARTLATLAETRQHLLGADAEVLAHYEEAITLLDGTGESLLQAGLHLQLGIAAHELASGGERARLREAVQHYQAALLVLREDVDPESFALANNNIALAFLAMPATEARDQLRLGMAVQSLRAALRVYSPGTHPAQWASTQLNLANALQYLPSAHRTDNLAEAVDLYEEVLAARPAAEDPLGRARVLANQANALAHLGAFADAEPRFHEARLAFVAAGDTAAVAGIDDHLAAIAARKETR